MYTYLNGFKWFATYRLFIKMRAYFTNKSLHKKLADVSDDVYSFLSKFQCSAFKKQIYLANDGYYEIKEDIIYRNYLVLNEPPPNNQKLHSDLILSSEKWEKKEVDMMPPNTIKVEMIVERFKITNTTTFVLERNDEETIDYFFEIKGKTIEDEVISFLSEITNVCVN